MTYQLNDRQLAAYVEAQWLDEVRRQYPDFQWSSTNRPVSDDAVFNQYYRRIPQRVINRARILRYEPESLLEIGPGLGRVHWELIEGLPSLKKVHAIEPCEQFAEPLRAMTKGEPLSVPMMGGSSLTLCTEAISQTYRRCETTLETTEVSNDTPLPNSDLVVCMNVLDQCADPAGLLASVQQAVAPGGFLVVGCSYQWPSKHMAESAEPIRDLNDWVPEGWAVCDEFEVDYRLRENARYALSFLTHVQILRKPIDQ